MIIQSQKPHFNLGKWLVVAISIAIIALLAYLVDVKKTLSVLAGMEIAPLVLAVLLAIFASYVIGGYKWMRVLSALGHKVPFKSILFLRLGSEPIKFVVPAKGGELIRPVYLKSMFNVPLPISIGSIALDKVFNLAGLMVLFGAAAFYTLDAGLGMGVLVLCFLGLFLIHRLARPASARLMEKEKRLYKALGEMLSTLHALSLPEIVIQVFFGGLFLFAEICTGFLCLRAAGVEVSFAAAATALPAVILFAQVPVTLSGIGSREAAMVAFFISYASKETLFAAGLAYTAVELLLPVAFGLPWLFPFLRKLERPEV